MNAPMISPLTQHIPLQNAYLCEDCETVGNCANTCPACASKALMALAAVLNREEVEREEHCVRLSTFSEIRIFEYAPTT